MPSVYRSFIPWILFFALVGHSESSKEAASLAAVLSHILFNHQSIRKGFVLDIGAMVFFLLFSANIFIFKLPLITDNGYLISNIAIALIAWVSLLIKRPFTLQYARLAVPLEIACSKLFQAINYILTAIWAILLSLMALPNIVELYNPIKYATDINVGVSLLLIIAGIWITNHLPNWLANKIVTKRFNVDIKKLYDNHKQPETDFTE